MTDKKILLVEGESDKSFFKEVCEALSPDTTVKVAITEDLGGSHNTKGGVKSQLSTLLKQLGDGQITHLGVIVDADYKEHGQGYQNTLDEFSNVIESEGFDVLNAEDNAGIIFKHTDGFNDLGLWIMPNNTEDGMLEDWMKSCVSDDEKPLFQQACDAVGNIAEPKFKDHLISKAEIATWLAWQDKPGHGLYKAMDGEILNKESILFQKLQDWLKVIFLS